MSQSTRPGPALMTTMRSARTTASSTEWVTKMTVSRYLKKPEQVSAPLRARIQQALDALGYIPNKVPDILSSSRSQAIGLLVLDLKNDQFDIEPVRSLTVLAEVLDEDSPQVMLMLYQPETVRIAQEMGFEACLKQHQSVANEPDFAEDVARLGAVAVCMHEPVTSRQTVRELHDEDIDVISYYLSSTPSTRFDRRVSELAQWGVSAIITDLVERSRNVLEPIGP